MACDNQARQCEFDSENIKKGKSFMQQGRGTIAPTLGMTNVLINVVHALTLTKATAQCVCTIICPLL